MDSMIIAQTAVSGILMGGVFALIAVGLSTIWGVMEVVNFAHGDFMMLAMFLTLGFFEYLGIIPIFSLPITAAIMGAIGVATYVLIIKPVIKGPMVAQIVVTFGLLSFIRNLAQFAFKANFRTLPAKAATLNGILGDSASIGSLMFSPPKLFAFILSIVFIATLDILFKRTKIGMALRATAQNRKAAQLVGVDINRMYAFSWGIGILFTGIGGVLLSLFHFIHPEVGLVFTLFSFIIVTLGGFGSIWGTFVAGLIIGMAESFGGVLIAPAYKFAVAYLIFIIVLFVKPQGLFGKG